MLPEGTVNGQARLSVAVDTGNGSGFSMASFLAFSSAIFADLALSSAIVVPFLNVPGFSSEQPDRRAGTITRSASLNIEWSDLFGSSNDSSLATPNAHISEGDIQANAVIGRKAASVVSRFSRKAALGVLF